MLEIFIFSWCAAEHESMYKMCDVTAQQLNLYHQEFILQFLSFLFQICDFLSLSLSFSLHNYVFKHAVTEQKSRHVRS